MDRPSNCMRYSTHSYSAAWSVFTSANARTVPCLHQSQCPDRTWSGQIGPGGPLHLGTTVRVERGFDFDSSSSRASRLCSLSLRDSTCFSALNSSHWTLDPCHLADLALAKARSHQHSTDRDRRRPSTQPVRNHRDMPRKWHSGA